MKSRRALLLYATHDGHTRQIVHRLADSIEAGGKPVLAFDLSLRTPTQHELQKADMLVFVAPIRFGYHLSKVEKFIRAYRDILHVKPYALVSINLTARKPDKNTPDTNPYYRKWVKRHRLTPVFAEVLAGKLAYPLYKTWEKWAIRLIMTLTGGPTHFDTVVDYTDWAKVDALAGRIVALEKEKAAA